jgi:hypothetical protein
MDKFAVENKAWLNNLDKSLSMQKIDLEEKKAIKDYFSKLNIIPLQNYVEKKSKEALKLFGDQIKKDPSIKSCLEKIGTPEEKNKLTKWLTSLPKESNPISIKMNDIVKNWLSKENQKVSEFNNNISSILTEQNNSFVDSIHNLANAISIQLEKNNDRKYKVTDASLNLNKIVSDKLISAQLSKENIINGVSAMNVANVLVQNGINKINLNEKTIRGLNDRNILVKANAFNSAVGREIINPEKDIQDSINAFASALSRDYSNNPEKVESQTGSVNSTIIKSPTMSTGNFQVYNINLTLNYAPLNGAGVYMNVKGQVVKYNLSQSISITNGISALASFSFGAAFLNGESSWYVGDYSQKIKSVNGVVPIANSSIALHYGNKNTSVIAGVRFLPGADAELINNKLKIKPTVQNEIFTAVNIKL